MNNKVKRFLLQEGVDQSKIIDAIKRRKEVRASYSADEDPKGTGERIIQPVAFGLSKSGNPVVRAFQPYGDTKTKVPHWKLFRLDKFEEWKTLNNRTFKEPPGMQYGADGAFNKNDDKSMSQVYVIANFDSASQRYERGGLKKHNEKVHAGKIAQNPYYDLEKQMKPKNKMMVGPNAMKEVDRWMPNDDMQKYLNGTSAKEMSKTTNFGDNTFNQTTEPVVKNSAQKTETAPQRSNTRKDYNNVAMNGPVVKGMETDKEENNNIDNENKEEEEI